MAYIKTCVSLWRYIVYFFKNDKNLKQALHYLIGWRLIMRKITTQNCPSWEEPFWSHDGDAAAEAKWIEILLQSLLQHGGGGNKTTRHDAILWVAKFKKKHF